MSLSKKEQDAIDYINKRKLVPNSYIFSKLGLSEEEAENVKKILGKSEKTNDNLYGEEQLEKIILFFKKNIVYFILTLGIILVILRIIFPSYRSVYSLEKGYINVVDTAKTLLQSCGIVIITTIIFVFLKKRRSIISFVKRNTSDIVLAFGSILIALRLFFLPDIKHGIYATALLQAVGIAVITGVIFYLLRKKQKK